MSLSIFFYHFFNYIHSQVPMQIVISYVQGVLMIIRSTLFWKHWMMFHLLCLIQLQRCCLLVKSEFTDLVSFSLKYHFEVQCCASSKTLWSFLVYYLLSSPVATILEPLVNVATTLNIGKSLVHRRKRIGLNIHLPEFSSDRNMHPLVWWRSIYPSNM